MQELEEWKEIKGCNGYYISSFGNVKGIRFDKPYITSLNKINEGYTNPQIAYYFKCDHSTISKIRTGRHYANVTI